MRCRTDHRNLTPGEKQRFVAAFHHVKAQGVVDAFAEEHDAHFDHGHRNSSFLPWHREFLRRFEAALQTYDERVMLCYWNSSEDQSTSSALWDMSFLGQFDAAWGLGRSLGAGGWVPGAGAVDGALGQTTYSGFWPDLERNVHNGPHGWVGGRMASSRSPHDPVFFLHHCYIDMLWAQWQLRNPGAAFEASAGAPGLNDQMHPWSTTPADVLDHRQINVYSYPAGYTPDAPRVEPPPAMPPSVTFAAVPEDLTFHRPAVFTIDSCETLTFDVADPVVDSGPAGASFERVEPSYAVDPHVDPVGRIWIAFSGTTAGDHVTGHVDVTCPQTGEAWVVPIVADVIPKPRAAIAMVLDQSNSMNEESGIQPGVKRSDVLRFSAPPALNVLDEDHAVMVISFDHDPHLTRGLTPTDGTGRLQLSGTIGDYAPNPEGWTAIGQAVRFAHDQLAPVTGYDVKAMIVLTDGKETHGPHDRLSLPEIMDQINEHVFAIGLGTAQALEPATLDALCRQTGNYMRITGELDSDAVFRLAKYYQQIAAGATNQQIVLDPEGTVHAGQIVRIPFWLAETDVTARAVLLTDNPHAVIFGLETPGGNVLGPTTPNPMAEFRVGGGFQMHRASLPLPIDSEEAHAGLWHALITIGRKGQSVAVTHMSSAASWGSARYCLQVQAYSDLAMHVTLDQSGNEPGAMVFLNARLEEYGVPLLSPAHVVAEIEAPNGTVSTVSLTPAGPGTYELSMQAVQMGLYQFRVVAQGTTSRGRRYTREAGRTAATWRGGDQPPTPPRDPGAKLCEAIHCLMKQEGVVNWLRRNKIDPEEVARCLDRFCGRPELRSGGVPEELTKLLRSLLTSGQGVQEFLRRHEEHPG